MAKYVYDENSSRFDIEDGLTITKGVWSDGNPENENRTGLFVTSVNDSNNVSVASAESYVCGVTVKNEAFLGFDNDKQHCVVQSLGLCTVRDDGTLVTGDKCMPADDGTAVKSSNALGYRVLGRVDKSHVRIIISPNNDMIQRIRNDVDEIITRQTSVTYEQFGAVLDGVNDDTDAVIACHNYANANGLKVEQHGGTVYLKTATAGNCPIIQTDTDLSGSVIKMDGSNAGNRIYYVRDPGMTIHSRTALRVNGDNYKTSLAEWPDSVVTVRSNMDLGQRGGASGSYNHAQTFLTDAFGAISPMNLYTPITGSEYIFVLNKLIQPIEICFGNIQIDGGVSEAAAIEIERSNVTVKNTSVTVGNIVNSDTFSNGLFTVKYSYNFKFENVVGNNIESDTMAPRTNYILDVYYCYKVIIERVHAIKQFGWIATHWTTDMTVRDSNINCCDCHYGMYGSHLIENSTLMGYPGVIYLGYGDATFTVRNCQLVKDSENGLSWNQIIQTRQDFAIQFSGAVNVENCHVILHGDGTEATRTLFVAQYETVEESFATPLSFAPTALPVLNVQNVRVTKDASARGLRLFAYTSSIQNFFELSKVSIEQPATDPNIDSWTGLRNIGTSSAVIELKNASMDDAYRSFAGTVLVHGNTGITIKTGTASSIKNHSDGCTIANGGTVDNTGSCTTGAVSTVNNYSYCRVNGTTSAVNNYGGHVSLGTAANISTLLSCGGRLSTVSGNKTVTQLTATGAYIKNVSGETQYLFGCNVS